MTRERIKIQPLKRWLMTRIFLFFYLQWGLQWLVTKGKRSCWLKVKWGQILNNEIKKKLSVVLQQHCNILSKIFMLPVTKLKTNYRQMTKCKWKKSILKVFNSKCFYCLLNWHICLNINVIRAFSQPSFNMLQATLFLLQKHNSNLFGFAVD